MTWYGGRVRPWRKTETDRIYCLPVEREKDDGGRFRYRYRHVERFVPGRKMEVKTMTSQVIICAYARLGFLQVAW